MEVILLEPVKKLGKSGEKVEVKNGFARNYLIPRGIALRANKENLAVYETRKGEIEKANAAKKADAEKAAKKLDGLKVTVLRQAAEDGRLYGSVTAKEIAEHINQKGYEVESKAVDLLTPIKTVGVFKVKLSIHAEVSVEVSVNVARSDSEAENQFAADQKANAEATAEQKSA